MEKINIRSDIQLHLRNKVSEQVGVNTLPSTLFHVWGISWFQTQNLLDSNVGSVLRNKIML